MTKTITERIIDEVFVGGHGYRLIVDRVTDVGVTYRSKIVSPHDETITTSPTKFRKLNACRKWAAKTANHFSRVGSRRSRETPGYFGY